MISRLALLAALLPWAAFAAPEPTPVPKAPEGVHSNWALLPNIALNDVLYPVPSGTLPAPRATVLGTTTAPLKTGHNVVMTLIRLDNQGELAATRPVDYVRCYEYFTPAFNQDGTRCFVLRPR